MTGESAEYAVRAVSALMGATFLALAIGTASCMRRSFCPTTAALVAVTPMVLYLNGSINPIALEMFTMASHFSKCMSGVSGAVLANTRALSLIWLTAAVVAAVVLYGFKPMVAVARNRLGSR